MKFQKLVQQSEPWIFRGQNGRLKAAPQNAEPMTAAKKPSLGGVEWLFKSLGTKRDSRWPTNAHLVAPQEDTKEWTLEDFEH